MRHLRPCAPSLASMEGLAHAETFWLRWAGRADLRDKAGAPAACPYVPPEASQCFKAFRRPGEEPSALQQGPPAAGAEPQISRDQLQACCRLRATPTWRCPLSCSHASVSSGDRWKGFGGEQGCCLFLPCLPGPAQEAVREWAARTHRLQHGEIIPSFCRNCPSRKKEVLTGPQGGNHRVRFASSGGVDRALGIPSGCSSTGLKQGTHLIAQRASAEARQILTAPADCPASCRLVRGTSRPGPCWLGHMSSTQPHLRHQSERRAFGFSRGIA